MFYLAGIIITFFLVFLLVGKRNKTIADQILLGWFCGIGVHLILVYLSVCRQIYQYPYLLGITIIFPLIHGPFLFLYVSALTNQLKNRTINCFHFLPALMSLVGFANFFLLSNASKIAVYENKGQGFEALLNMYSILVKTSGIVYVVWSLVLLQKHRQNILGQFSNTDRINLNWLQYLIWGVAVVWIFVLIENTRYLYVAVVVFVVLMGYLGINQVGIFALTVVETTSEIKIPVDENLLRDKKTKYLKSGLTETEAAEIHALLADKMQTQQWFVNPDLTLVELAKLLEVHPNILSQVINTYEEKNFYDYINALRVAKFISMAQQPENKKFTILSLCYDCGFNSKSSFNKHFKRITQTTPSAFINSISP